MLGKSIEELDKSTGTLDKLDSVYKWVLQALVAVAVMVVLLLALDTTVAFELLSDRLRIEEDLILPMN